MPSLKNFCSGSLLRLAKGRIATDGLPGRAVKGPAPSAQRSRPIPFGKIEMNRLREVLDRLGALVGKLDIQLVADFVAYRLRASNPAGTRQALQADSHIETVSVKILPVDDEVAEIDSHPKFEMAVLGRSGIALFHGALDFHRAARRTEHACELDEKSIAHDLENAPVMFCDGRVENIATMALQRREGSFLVGLHQPAIANHVCC